jgi:hypothetical protein
MEWKKFYRIDGRLEWVCEHGVGHPDVNIAKLLAKEYGDDPEDVWTVHGCDGCCCREDFPGIVKCSYETVLTDEWSQPITEYTYTYKTCPICGYFAFYSTEDEHIVTYRCPECGECVKYRKEIEREHDPRL